MIAGTSSIHKITRQLQATTKSLWRDAAWNKIKDNIIKQIFRFIGYRTIFGLYSLNADKFHTFYFTFLYQCENDQHA